MKKIIVFICLIQVVGLLHSQESIGDVYDIQVLDQVLENSLYDQVWEPYIAQWDNQTYVVAYGKRLKGKSDMGDIVCSVSNDRGNTWGVPNIIFNSQLLNGTKQYSYANAVLYKDPSQDILWCYAMRCPSYYRNSEESEIVAAYSGDGGRSWIHVELTMDFHSPMIIVGGIMKVSDDSGDYYLLPAHRNTKRSDPLGDRQQFVLKSRDLLHWKLADYVPMPEPKIFLHEGNIAPWAEPGSLKMVMRTATYEKERQLDPPIAYSSISNDNGQTWSMAKPEPELHNAVSKAFYGKDDLGNNLYVYSSGQQGERKELWYKVKAPKQNWSEAKKFYFDNNRNSYPTLIEEKPGEWLCVWDSSNSPEDKRTAIRFGRLNINKNTKK